MAPGLFIKRRRVWVPCAFVTALVLIYAFWPEPKVDPAPPLPSPNGYDDFIKAGQLLMRWSSADYSRMSREELQSVVGTNQEPLRLVRLGLKRDCQVPTEDSMAYQQKHLPDLSSVKYVALLLSAEGRLAEAEARYDDAAKTYLEVMRFGQASAHGGLIIDKLVGVAVENIGLVGLEKTANQLNTQSCRATISALEKNDERADPAVLYIKRDRQWARKVIGSTWIQETLVGKWLMPQQQAAEQKFTTRVLAADRRRRQLILNLASRAYELENGKRPLRAEDLVPSLLRSVPKDPESGTNLVLNPVN